MTFLHLLVIINTCSHGKSLFGPWLKPWYNRHTQSLVLQGESKNSTTKLIFSKLNSVFLSSTRVHNEKIVQSVAKEKAKCHNSNIWLKSFSCTQTLVKTLIEYMKMEFLDSLLQIYKLSTCENLHNSSVFHTIYEERTQVCFATIYIFVRIST